MGLHTHTEHKMTNDTNRLSKFLGRHNFHWIFGLGSAGYLGWCLHRRRQSKCPAEIRSDLAVPWDKRKVYIFDGLRYNKNIKNNKKNTCTKTASVYMLQRKKN